MKVEVKMPGQTISCSGEDLELQLSGKVHLKVVDGILKITAEPLDAQSNLSKSSTVQLIEQTSKILQEFDLSEDDSVVNVKAEPIEEDTVAEEEPETGAIVQEGITTTTEIIGTTETPTQLFSWTDEEEAEQKDGKAKMSTPTENTKTDAEIEKRLEALKSPVQKPVPVSVTKRKKRRQSRRITSVAELMSTIQKINEK